MSTPPLFSICIPHYNRTSFLLKVCESLAAQSFREFELCLSDDGSTDGREGELLASLQRSALPHTYVRQPRTLRYDGNLRAAIALARGRYCLLLGNDDALADPETLAELAQLLTRYPDTGVAITNYEQAATGRVCRRIRSTGLLGHGPQVAVRQFRNFSFLGGILLETTEAQAQATARWDGSEMYQMYLGCRLIAAGQPLLGIDRVAVREGIQLPGEQVESYATRPRIQPCPITPRHLPLHQIGPLVAEAIEPFTPPAQQPVLVESIARQLLSFTYPFWLIEYRRVQSWRYALGVSLAMRPRMLTGGRRLSGIRRWRLRLLYLTMGVAGLTLPIGLFSALRPALYALAKSVSARQR